MQMSGIDVSHYQNKIDWSQMRGRGITFAFVKATEGVAVIDPLFNSNWKVARSWGIRRGAYHFFRPDIDPEQQAAHFLQTLNGDTGELPPALDVETIGRVTPDSVIDRARCWLKFVQARVKRQPIVYTGSAFWRMSLNDSGALSEYPLWIAHYTSGPRPLVPRGWPRWTFWQFSQKGKIPGITGCVDLNAFNGTEAELDDFCNAELATA